MIRSGIRRAAQQMLGTGGASVSYNYTMAYGLRDITGLANPAVELSRSSDSATSEFVASASGLDYTAIDTWLGGATGTVKRWMDQTGNGLHQTDVDGARWPVLDTTNEMIVFNSDGYTDPEGSVAINTPCTIFFVAKARGTTQQTTPYFDSPGYDTQYFARRETNGNVYVKMANEAAYIPDPGTDFVIFAIVGRSTASHSFYVNGGTATTWGSGASSEVGTLAVAARAQFNHLFTGDYYEFSLIDGELDTSQLNALGSEIATFYGLTWTTVT